MKRYLKGRKKRDSNIKDVVDYIKNDKIVDIYITSDIDGDKIIEEYNKEAPKYERVASYNIKRDSLDTRLKQ